MEYNYLGIIARNENVENIYNEIQTAVGEEVNATTATFKEFNNEVVLLVSLSLIEELKDNETLYHALIPYKDKMYVVRVVSSEGYLVLREYDKYQLPNIESEPVQNFVSSKSKEEQNDNFVEELFHFMPDTATVERGIQQLGDDTMGSSFQETYKDLLVRLEELKKQTFHLNLEEVKTNLLKSIEYTKYKMAQEKANHLKKSISETVASIEKSDMTPEQKKQAISDKKERSKTLQHKNKIELLATRDAVVEKLKELLKEDEATYKGFIFSQDFKLFEKELLKELEKTKFVTKKQNELKEEHPLVEQAMDNVSHETLSQKNEAFDNEGSQMSLGGQEAKSLDDYRKLSSMVDLLAKNKKPEQKTSEKEGTVPLEKPKKQDEQPILPKMPPNRSQVLQEEKNITNEEPEEVLEEIHLNNSQGLEENNQDKVDKKRIYFVFAGLAAITVSIAGLFIARTVLNNKPETKQIVEQSSIKKKKTNELSDEEYDKNVETLAGGQLGMYIDDEGELRGTLTVKKEDGTQTVRKIREYTKKGELKTLDENGGAVNYKKEWVENNLLKPLREREKDGSSKEATELQTSSEHTE